jgi:pimeloyl-ACP methyl ester carboxylesterase
MHETQAQTGRLGFNAVALASALNFLASYQPGPMGPLPAVPLREMSDGLVRAPDGRELAYREHGDPAGAPVVFHHGTPGSRLGRHPDESVYAACGVRLVAYDRPGYGRSSPRPGRRVADAAGDTRTLADALGLERFGVLGVSGGGPHALACAALLGGRVTRAAVMVGAAPSDDPGFDFLAGMAELNVREFGAAVEGPEAIAAYLAPFVEELERDPDLVLETIAREVPAPDRAVLARPDARQVMRDSLAESVRQGVRGWADDDLAFAAPWGFEIGAIATPVRLWQGELDVLVPRSHAEYLQARIPEATFELVPDAGHFLLDELEGALRWLAAGS